MSAFKKLKEKYTDLLGEYMIYKRLGERKLEDRLVRIVGVTDYFVSLEVFVKGKPAYRECVNFASLHSDEGSEELVPISTYSSAV